jgi:hypothetical protein
LSPERDRNPRSDVVANKWSQYRALQRRAAAYKTLLQDDVEEVDVMGEMLKKQLDRL